MLARGAERSPCDRIPISHPLPKITTSKGRLVATEHYSARCGVFHSSCHITLSAKKIPRIADIFGTLGSRAYCKVDVGPTSRDIFLDSIRIRTRNPYALMASVDLGTLNLAAPQNPSLFM